MKCDDAIELIPRSLARSLVRSARQPACCLTARNDEDRNRSRAYLARAFALSGRPATYTIGA